MRQMATLALMGVIFVLTVLTTVQPSILTAGAIDPKMFWYGEAHRLFTAMWLHLNIAHGWVNMLLLFFVGSWLEPQLGYKPIVLMFLLGGLVGNVFHALFEPLPGLGASGGVYALTLVAIMILHRRWAGLQRLERLYMGILVTLAGVGIVVGLTINLLPNFPIRASNAGHIGGAIVGMLFGAYINGTRQEAAQ